MGCPQGELHMDEIDALLDALWNAAINGDTEAAIFLQMFAPWAASQMLMNAQHQAARHL
jgi:hypothetical protein